MAIQIQCVSVWIPLPKSFLTAQAVNPRFPLHVHAMKRKASPIDYHPDILQFVTLSLSKDILHYFRRSRFCLDLSRNYANMTRSGTRSFMGALSTDLSTLCRDKSPTYSSLSANRSFVISQSLGDTWPDPTRVSRRVGEIAWERGCFRAS